MSRVRKFHQKFIAANGRETQVTCFTISGTAPGPVLTIIAGQHGMEHSGPNLLPEFIEELSRREFAGTVHVCPCANPLALEMDYEFYPEHEDISKIKDYYYSIFRHNYCPWKLGRDDGETLYNMNRLWNDPDAPGIAGQIAQWLWKEICAEANIIIDMHCLQAEKPLIFNSFQKNNAIARYTGIEAVVMCNPNPPRYGAGNLTWQGSRGRNQYSICIEFSRQHGLKESEYELGKQSVRNVMIGANMMEGEVILDRPVWEVPYDSKGTRFRASHTGHIRYFFNLYDEVKKGDRVFQVRDIETLDVLEEGIAENDGILCAVSHLPVIKPGVMPCSVPKANLLAKSGVLLEKLPKDFFNQ
jgi:predicted deacylase